jgi:hypothetical protein
MQHTLRTLLIAVIAAAFVGHADFADAAKKKTKPTTSKPSSYAPGPPGQRVHGAPIQGPIVTSAATRSARARTDFQKLRPCPATGKREGACPGYTISYLKPLNKGGANAPSNMQWKATQVAKAKSKP